MLDMILGALLVGLVIVVVYVLLFLGWAVIVWCRKAILEMNDDTEGNHDQ